MKKIIGIWVGVIALVLIVGVVWGAIEKKQQADFVPEIEHVQVTIGYDENNNPIVENVEKEEITVKIDGDLYTYNAGALNEKSFWIEGIKFDFNFNESDFSDNGFEEMNITKRRRENSTVTINYNNSGRGLSLQAYSAQFLENSDLNVPICEKMELPHNIKLGESTLKEVQAIYGVSKVYLASKHSLTTTKYYLDENKTTGFIVLSFDPNDILCKIEIHCGN